MTDRMYLVASWPFLTTYVGPRPCSRCNRPPDAALPSAAAPRLGARRRLGRSRLRSFRTIATEVQQRVELTFDRETALGRSRTEPGVRGNGLSPVLSGSDQFARRRANQPLRSLVELTGSKVRSDLHAPRPKREEHNRHWLNAPNGAARPRLPTTLALSRTHDARAPRRRSSPSCTATQAGSSRPPPIASASTTSLGRPRYACAPTQIRTCLRSSAYPPSAVRPRRGA